MHGRGCGYPDVNVLCCSRRGSSISSGKGDGDGGGDFAV